MHHEMKHIEPLGYHGQLNLKVYKNIGSTEEFKRFLKEEKNRKAFGFKVIRKDNLIVDVGLMIATRSLYPDNNKGIVAMAFGSGGAPSEDLLTPIPPVTSDVELGTEEFRLPIDSANVSYSDVSPFSITFTTIVTNSDFQGISWLNEAGLVSHLNKPGGDPVDSMDLFSRLTFPSISFSGSEVIGILAEWTIFATASSAAS